MRRHVSPRRPYSVKVHWPYVVTEAAFVVYQLAWMVLFAVNGLAWCALGAGYMAACVVALAVRYGDDTGKCCFVIDTNRLRVRGRRNHGADETPPSPLVLPLPAVSALGAPRGASAPEPPRAA